MSKVLLCCDRLPHAPRPARLRRGVGRSESREALGQAERGVRRAAPSLRGTERGRIDIGAFPRAPVSATQPSIESGRYYHALYGINFCELLVGTCEYMHLVLVPSYSTITFASFARPSPPWFNGVERRALPRCLTLTDYCYSSFFRNFISKRRWFEVYFRKWILIVSRNQSCESFIKQN